MYPEAQRVLRGLSLHGSIQEHVGDVVGNVLSVLVGAAYDEVVPPCGAGPLFALRSPAEQRMAGGYLKAQALQKLQAFFVSYAAGLLVGLEYRAHVLVEAASGGGSDYAHAPVEIERLYGFTESARRVCRHPAAGLGYLQQLCLTFFVLAFGGHLLGQIRVPFAAAHEGFQHHYRGAQEGELLKIVHALVVQVIELLLAPAYHLVAAGKHVALEIGAPQQAHSKAVAPAALPCSAASPPYLCASPRRTQEPPADELPHAVVLVVETGLLVAGAPGTLPVIVVLPKCFARFIGHGDGACADQDVQILVRPCRGIRRSFHSERNCSLVSHDKLVVIDEDGLFVQIFRLRDSTLIDHRDPCVLLVRVQHDIVFFSAYRESANIGYALFHASDPVGHDALLKIRDRVRSLLLSRSVPVA